MHRRFKKNISPDIDSIIKEIYEIKKKNIIESASKNNNELCLSLLFDLWMFMNRFRNCDLQKYYDEDLHSVVKGLNPKKFDTSYLLKHKKIFRIAFIMLSFSDTGGASLPHRFILDEYSNDEGVEFQQYLLITNIGREKNSLNDSEQFRYAKDKLNLVECEIMKPIQSWVERGQYIELWLHEREIDFAIVNPEPSVLYALGSNPTLFSGILSQDCYAFALGPGAGDITYLVTTDQLFKYRFDEPSSERRMKVIMLPLHPQEYIDSANPIDLGQFGVPENAVVSATTNLWKSCFGDEEMLFEGIAALIRKYPHFHHLFVGTPRCLDNLEFFLNKNPDIKENIHFTGPIKNIYQLLKSIDFYVNSFPTSGGSDLECAMVGKPSIEFLWNRNLTLHGCEFLRTPECEVITLDEFIELGSHLISDPIYRKELGRFLKQKISREFDKDRLVKEGIYDFFISEFNKKLGDTTPFEEVCMDETLEYEKCIALYNAYGKEHWEPEKRWLLLDVCLTGFPEKPFAWIKSLEEAIQVKDHEKFTELVGLLPEILMKDHRIHIMLSLGYDTFREKEKAIKHALAADSLAIYDKIPARVAARLLVSCGRLDKAVQILSKTLEKVVVDKHNIRSILSDLPEDNMPLYYNY